eukprot:CAMPEP_0119419134 /NCGR_PEP_ID=MMETSP1335-20130426/20051_1 /TAXON_ID=259385 /ORGANISM="Chrysoculter rhomboideus, Strain RCC1486" /LENGTH=61 /DNA_ID=CAMNT_0007444423 /DNA_START=290 /DNA_END=475 /DNA_ORIENTATION=-
MARERLSRDVEVAIVVRDLFEGADITQSKDGHARQTVCVVSEDALLEAVRGARVVDKPRHV